MQKFLILDPQKRVFRRSLCRKLRERGRQKLFSVEVCTRKLRLDRKNFRFCGQSPARFCQKTPDFPPKYQKGTPENQNPSRKMRVKPIFGGVPGIRRYPQYPPDRPAWTPLPASNRPCSRTGTATIPWPWRPRCASCWPSSTLDAPAAALRVLAPADAGRRGPGQQGGPGALVRPRDKAGRAAPGGAGGRYTARLRGPR